MSNLNRTHVLRAFSETPWAILPNTLAVLDEIVTRHVAGEKLDAEEIQARIGGAAGKPLARRVGKVAIVPIFGTIVPRANLLTNVSGATSAEQLAKDLSALVRDPEIGAIVLDVDSPGGQVQGVAELATQIYDARQVKPVVAIANHQMASAAYWIASAASEIVVTPSGEVGSIGVLAVHRDVSAAQEREGVRTTIISRGKYKTEGNPYQALSDEARAAIQARVDDAYDQFVQAVSLHRGVSVADVRDGFGEGRTVSALKAVKLGMADRIDTLEGVLQFFLGADFKITDRESQQAAFTSAPTADNSREAQRLRDYVQIYK